MRPDDPLTQDAVAALIRLADAVDELVVSLKPMIEHLTHPKLVIEDTGETPGIEPGDEIE